LFPMAVDLVDNNAHFCDFVVINAVRHHEGPMILDASRFILVSYLVLFNQR